LRNNLNIKTISDEDFEHLKTSIRGKDHIINIANYDILSNTRYADKFYYNIMDREQGPSYYICRMLYLGEDQAKFPERNVREPFKVYQNKIKKGLLKHIEDNSLNLIKLDNLL
jgi:hypothetical protein